jgi:hypothetical protein
MPLHRNVYCERNDVNKAEFKAFIGRRVLCVSLLALLAAPALAQEQTTDNSWKKETLQEFVKIEHGGTVRVDNPFGNIYSRFGGYEDTVEVLATVQRLDHGLPEPQIDYRRSGPGVDITVRAGGGEKEAKEPVERSDRVDLVVFVPMGSRLDARTEKDLIDVKGLKGDLAASSIKGDIRIRAVKGRVTAKTDRGQLSAALETAVTDQPQEFSTVTGDIEIYLWEDADMTVDIRTTGEISTDFSITIEHHPFEEPGKLAKAVVGDGGPKLSMYSKRGRVKLLRLQKDFTPKGKE